MANGLQNHQVDISKYAKGLNLRCEKEVRELLDTALEIKVWRADDRSWKAEVLIAFGGPTVRIDLDSRWEEWHTLTHSWGADSNGNDKKSVEIYSPLLYQRFEECFYFE